MRLGLGVLNLNSLAEPSPAVYSAVQNVPTTSHPVVMAVLLGVQPSVGSTLHASSRRDSPVDHQL